MSSLSESRIPPSGVHRASFFQTEIPGEILISWGPWLQWSGMQRGRYSRITTNVHFGQAGATALLISKTRLLCDLARLFRAKRIRLKTISSSSSSLTLLQLKESPNPNGSRLLESFMFWRVSGCSFMFLPQSGKWRKKKVLKSHPAGRGGARL